MSSLRFVLRAAPPAFALSIVIARLAPAQERDTTRLDPVIVTATRVPVSLPASSLATTVIGGDELRARGIALVADALRHVPGLTVVRTGSYGGITSLFMRGGESDYVKVLIDGVPLNAAGGGIDLSTLTTDNVDRIEIVRGPGSVLYGSDAVTGVVQIFTRDGRGASGAGAAGGAIRGAVQARGGSFGWREGTAELSGGGARAGGALAIATRRTDGIHAFNNRFGGETFDATFRASPGAHTDVRLDARLSDSEAQIPTNGRGEVVDSNQVRLVRRRTLGISVAHLLAPRVAGRLELGLARTDAVSDDQPDSPGDTLGYYSRSESEALRQRADARVDLHLRDRAVLTVGSEWSRQREDARGEAQLGRDPLPGTHFDASRDNQAVYAQLLSGGGDRLSATAGVRLDDNERFGTFTTARGSLAWRSGATTLRAAGGSAFKEPAFSEHFTTPFSVGNPALEPERTVSWEVGIGRAFASEYIVLSATWFDQRFRDMIQYLWQEDPTAPNYVNVAAARARGLEIEARSSWRTIDASASWAWVRTAVTEAGHGDFGAFEEGKPLLRRPEHTLSVEGRWRAGDRAVLTANAQRVGRRDDLDFAAFPAARVILDPYTLVDAGVELGLLELASAGDLRLTVRIENALGERYQPVRGFAAPGRAILVGIRAELGR
ncbi:MAG TPA: TonB-dependent receptor [Gemmatimonadaceae bacterium]|nr:TonB-dependent receptor [Gemmatimonadaceae bacterium]